MINKDKEQKQALIAIFASCIFILLIFLVAGEKLNVDKTDMMLYICKDDIGRVIYTTNIAETIRDSGLKGRDVTCKINEAK